MSSVPDSGLSAAGATPAGTTAERLARSRTRERGTTTALPEWATRPERSNVVALGFMALVALYIGRAPARWLLPPICVYYMLFAPKVRAASREFLTVAMGRKPTTRDYYKHIHTFACTILDRVFFLNDQIERFEVTVYGQELMDQVLASGEGCFLLGSHLGSFEVLRTQARATKNLDVSLVMYERNARKVNAVLNAINPNLAMDVIGLGNSNSMLRVQEALSQGHFVGMLGDRNFVGEGVVPCKFFGRTTHCPVGPFRMSVMLKRPLVLMAGLYRGGNKYDLHFELLPNPADVPRAERGQAIEAALQAYVDRLEHYCRAAPYNWFNFYDFWNQGSEKGTEENNARDP
ncbi:MAG TPA: acyl-CoA synthetase [Burkholderiales bacterium]|jgi:predicted LPLAT superfamily acyltransferase|nr:acyl-CoA synthetase [Burkholderiales bacterium]